ncbi:MULTISPECIES: putative lipid II flippase FtsW [Pseudorhizobium]|jgi:cell division protein FtsW|uniref:Probable peptidoglycan glycosyltransferase FtsW n=1 Tax=Pseudorhizobium pelagicum TaxID=1509405 RepID=A0A922P457_9HYPH|nr:MULTISPECIES: putative lipid II flippase FtsW [Pseudorhizobium]MBU1315215.1 putative lipid II flippase FtsW [Alphaproteobacteria bacterium]MDY6960907.1 putative lipid II flippase FtsW [Pseudomonadota bacterium]KEQ05035.1 cell division protein FtsW [Pseudorhizobium pelagicum]KEQ07548.1 cell division protein FtsW [Pseudorhizobium pelagicum]MBU1550546.1 putative lipid II flippase FtsW [Alphaproteobacteria bacterium]|tara:strand:- start:377 stop:1531 length:1155 start_codon:yes stop_codon:yes gene_type:complete
MVSRADRGPLADWFWTIDRFFLAAFILLMGVGFMLSFAASPPVAERLGLDSFHFVKRHAVFIVPSLAVMIGLSFLTPRQVRRAAVILLGISLLLMVIALFFGVEVKGSRRWVSIASFSLQPSEFMKPAFVVVCAWLFAEHARQPEIPGNLFAIILFGIVAALLVAQPDLGQTILTSVVWGGMFFMAGMPWLWIMVLGMLGAGGFLTAYYMLPHVAGRIDRFLTGEGDTFQVDTARDAIIRGDWFGQGPGEGIVKRIIPDSHTDFIFSVAAEEFGILFCMLLVAIFAFIVLRGLSHAFKERNDFNRFAVAGLVLQLGIQSMINVGVNLELMPAKGMTLPLISYGGSSMIAVCVTAGFILALTRHRPEKRAQERSLFRVTSAVPAE